MPAPSPAPDPSCRSECLKEGCRARGWKLCPSAPMTTGWRWPCQGALRVHSERPGPARTNRTSALRPPPADGLVLGPWGLPSPHFPQAPSDFLSSAPDRLVEARVPSCLPPGQGYSRMQGGRGTVQ